MKMIFCLLFVSCFTLPSIAQLMPKVNNALLLDYYQNQRFEEARIYLQEIYAEPITDVKILSGLGYTSQMAGKLPQAEEYYKRIYAIDSVNTGILFSLGSISARTGNYINALTYYKKILLRDSTNFNVYRQMGTLWQNLGSTTEAMKYYERANKINPVELDVAYDLTSYYINQKLYNRADTVVSIALKADTNNLMLLLGKAQTNYQLNNYLETVILCKKLIAKGNQTGTVISMLGTSYFKINLYSDCIKILKLLEDNKTASETSYYYTAMSFKH